MPIYQYKNEETGEVTDHYMSISSMEEFEKENPNMKKVIHAPAIGDAVRMGVRKTDEGFNDLLKSIKKNKPGSTIKTR
jgi:predicted nucleic acid-binding Zn ribbon protein